MSAPRILCADVLRIVVEHYDVTLEELRCAGQQHRVVQARRTASWLCRRLTPGSLPQIGRHLSLDHSTVLACIRKAEQRRAIDQAYAAELAKLELAVRARLGTAHHPADFCLRRIDADRLARSVLADLHGPLSYVEAVSLARAYLTTRRALEPHLPPLTGRAAERAA